MLWRPSDFWEATVDEYLMAYDGYAEANKPTPPSMERDEFEELMEQYPDGPKPRPKKSKPKKER